MSHSTLVAQRDAALAFLFGRIDYERARPIPYGERTFKLARMRELVERLGRPDAGLPVIHIAGTKGKGSTAAMVAALLRVGGYRTGVFSSPHLERIEERFAVDGRPCSADELCRLVERVRPVVERMDALARSEHRREGGPTFFEITTAMALCHFAEQKVDAAVLEVGLGGRLDSTNVCQPRVTAITSISFDHTEQLGDTLSAIAGEKAGIVKPGIPLVSGVTQAEPRDVIAEACRRRGAPLIEIGRQFDYGYRPGAAGEAEPVPGRFDFEYRVEGAPVRYDDVPLELLGRHQAANAAAALAIVAQFCRNQWPLADGAIRRGLREASCPARVEVVARRPTVVVDAAHNVASVEALLDTLDESFPAKRTLLLFATSQDKDIEGMLSRLLPRFSQAIFTRFANNPRGTPPDELAQIARQLDPSPCIACPDTASAWRTARDLLHPDDLLCVTGSFYLAAEMREQIARHPLAALNSTTASTGAA